MMTADTLCAIATWAFKEVLKELAKVALAAAVNYIVDKLQKLDVMEFLNDISEAAIYYAKKVVKMLITFFKSFITYIESWIQYIRSWFSSDGSSGSSSDGSPDSTAGISGSAAGSTDNKSLVRELWQQKLQKAEVKSSYSFGRVSR